MSAAPSGQVTGLAAFQLVTADAQALGAFYRRAFGFGDAGETRAVGSRVTTLRLGEGVLELRRYDVAGAPYPAGASSADLVFQHLAIVVSDMAAAFQRLNDAPGWSAISRGGPVRLPASSGGVTAFKFRDPEGHPLELLQFPAGAVPPAWRIAAGETRCLGIDHSAISVADPARSIAFYQALGLGVSSRTLNQGAGQADLDGLADPRVRVIALSPAEKTPHVELLGYQRPTPREGAALADNDIAATCLVFDAAGQASRELVDPDGHRLILRPR